MTFARVLVETGLTKVELAALYGVSRQTIHQWACGQPPRADGYTARMAESITTALLAAVKAGRLPWTANMDKSTRQRVVASLASALQRLTPAPIKG